MSAIGDRIRAGGARIAGAATGAALVLILVAGLGAFAVTAVPRVNARVQTTALHEELSAAGANLQVVTGTAPLADLASALYPGQNGIAVSAAQTAQPETSLRTQMSSLGIPVAPSTADYWSGLVSEEHPTNIAGLAPAQAKLTPVKTALAYRGSLAEHTTMVAGSLPDHAIVPGTQGNGQPVVFDVAISQATAAQFSLHLNEIVSTAAVSTTSSPAVQMDITGIFKPTDPGDEFWSYDNLANAPVETIPSSLRAGVPYWASDMFIGPDELAALQYAFEPSAITLQYCLPVELSNITAVQALPLANLFNRATSDAVNLPQSSNDGSQSGTIDVALITGPATLLDAFAQQRQDVGAVLALVFGSLTALGAAVLLLCVLLLAERRAAEFALLRARGAASRQLAALGGRVGAAAAIPAAAGALLAIAVVRGPVDPWTDWRPTGVIIVAALLGPALLAVRTARRGAGGTGGTRAGGTGSRTPAKGNRARRIVAHVAVHVVCIGSVVLERVYGATSGNLLTSTAPFLLAVPIALVLYYIMPFAIRAMTRIAAHRRGVVSFVGLARASRGSIASLLPSFALVLALAVLAVGTMVHDTVTSGEQRGSWAAVGADDLVASAIKTSSNSFTPGAVSALSSTPGVARSASAVLINTNDANFAGEGGSLPNDTMIVVVDPAQFNALVAGTPVSQLPASLLGGTAKPGTPIPVVASPSIANLLENGASGAGGVTNGNPTLDLDGGATFPVRIMATQATAPELPGAANFMIVPRWGLGQYADSLSANLLMLNGPVDSAALTATVQRTAPGATITRRADALNALTKAPFQSGTFDLLDLAMLAAVLLAIVVLLANLALGAASREATLARLATMGLSRGQSNRLMLVENVPSIAGALLGGAACTVAIGALVGAGIDLSVFTGTGQSVPLSIDPWTLAAAGGAIAATAVLTLAGHTMAAHRRGVTASLRVGEQ